MIEDKKSSNAGLLGNPEKSIKINLSFIQYKNNTLLLLRFATNPTR